MLPRGPAFSPQPAPGRADLWPRRAVEAALTTPVTALGGTEARARAGVGGTRFAAGEESRVVLHRADTSMYEAKRGAAAVLN